MFSKVKEKLQDSDQFAYNPETAITFNKKAQFTTLPGGVASISLGVFFFVMWYQNFNQMFKYQGNTNMENTTTANLTALGNITLSKMQVLPLILPYYKGNIVPRTSKTMCKEFGGDCFQFVKKHLKIEWIDYSCESAVLDCKY